MNLVKALERRTFIVRPTLVIMAAGMGCRYGGLKQIDLVGSNNEIIMDYSIYAVKM